MDTLILRYESAGTMRAVRRDHLPAIPMRLTWLERIIKKVRTVKSFLFCEDPGDVADWEFNIMTKRSCVAMLDDDCEFSDLASALVSATTIEQYNDEQLLTSLAPPRYFCATKCDDPTPSEYETDDDDELASLPDLVCVDDDLWKIPAISATHCNNNGGTHPFVEAKLNVRDAELRLAQTGHRTWRRRRRLLPYAVVALVNLLRAKYYRMRDVEANRRSMAQYLLKKLREHGWRTVDIHLHVDHAINLYFTANGAVEARY